MSNITSPHDKFFKESFSQLEIARDFLTRYLPQDVRDLLDLDQITIQKDSFVDSDFHEHFSDLLFLIPMKDGGEIYVYTLFEHKSYPDSWVALQLLRYMVKIWERDVKDAKADSLTGIIPIVVYHGEQEWRVSTELAALFPDYEKLRPFLPNFHYLIYDLPRYQENEIVGEYKLRMAIWIMKYIFNPELLKKIGKAISIYAESKRDMDAEEFLKTVLLYIMTAGVKVNHEELYTELKNRLRYAGADNIMMTIAEHLRQEGLQEGLQKGMEQGIEQGMEKGWQSGRQEGIQEGLYTGKLDDIQKILKIRFGGFPAEVTQNLEKINDPEALDNLLTIAVTVNSLSGFIERL